ncbi:MAG: AAA family ATPase [Pseudomonadota bacterium]
MTLRFDAIRLRHVRRFGSEGIALEDLSPGLNVLSAANEFGKSTILAALKVALFYKATSAHKEVLALKSADGHPEIEVDFSSGGQAFRLRKTFRRGRGESRLLTRPDLRETAREAEAEAQMASLLGADKPEQGPGGLLWLDQGAALTHDLGKPQRETVASLLSSGAHDIAGGEEALRVLSQAEKALFELETKAKGQPTGPLKAALDEVESAKTKLRTLNDAVTHAEDVKTALDTARRQEGELNDPEAERSAQDELAAARQALAEMRAVQDRLRHNLAEIKALEAQKEGAVDKLNEYDHTVERFKTMQKAAQEAKGRTAELEAQLQAAQQRRHEAATGMAKARKALKTAEAALALSDQYARRDQDQERSVAAQNALLRIRTLRQERDTAETLLRLGLIDKAKLQKLERQVMEARAALIAGAPLVELMSGSAMLDGSSLAPGAPRPVTADGVIEAGATRLKITGPGRAAAAAQLSEANAQMDHFLSEMNVATVEEAWEAASLREDAARTVKTIRADIEALAPDGVAALEDLARRNPQDGEKLAPRPDDPRAVLAVQCAEAQRTLQDADAQAANEASLMGQAEVALAQHQGLIAGEEGERLRLAKELGSENEQAQERQSLAKKLETVRGQIALRRAEMAESETALADHERLTLKVKRLEEVAANRERTLRRARDERIRAETELRQIFEGGAEEKRDAAAELLAVAEERLTRLERRRQALRLLVSTLKAVQSERRDRLLAPLTRELTPLANMVFGASVLRFEDELTPTGLERSGEELSVGALSQGTQEQVTILTRLAFARLLARQGRAVPVFLDDALIYADDERTRRVFDVLQLVASETQVVVFTCHERLFDHLGGHRLEPQPFGVSGSS